MKQIIPLLLLLMSFCSHAQQELNALRITEKIKIDGKLEESVWQKAEIASDFTVWQPNPGDPSSRKTEVRILYDDDALYVGAYLQAESRAEIQTQLSQRDDFGQTDWFGFIIDTYQNGLEASEFIVGASGVQFDARIGENGEDPNWNEVWYSEVHLTNEGWYVEMKIPYYTLRFPKTDVQEWNFNLMRQIASSAEKSSFKYIDPEVQGFITQCARLKGIKDIKSPLRLSLSPYITTYAQNSSDGAQSSTSFSYNGGMDLKYGINEAFTLDMTLIPDFGQVRSDDNVLNLSPFEVQFDENRAFFTEGTELFSKGNIFYSRRIGGRPIGYWNTFANKGNDEIIVDNPTTTKLYNASKISGRTKGGLGIGVLNAIGRPTHATIEKLSTGEKRMIETAPLTNYNITVLDQNLPNNSTISLINSNVSRKGDLYHNANVTATQFDIKNKAQSYSVSGGLNVSQILYKGSDNVIGLKYNGRLSKISGTLAADVSYAATSSDYTHNDLGFFTQNNFRNYGFSISNRFLNRVKQFNQLNVWFNADLNTTYEEDKFNSLHFNTGFWAQTKGFWSINMWTNYRPGSIDRFEARVPGMYVNYPGMINQGWNIQSDFRKPFHVGMSIFGRNSFEKGNYSTEISVFPSYRVNDKLSINLESSVSDVHGQVGFVTFDNNNPILGRRDRLNITNIFGFSYVFTDKMSMDFRARHNWNKVQYSSFHNLDQGGDLTSTTYNEHNDFDYNVFNIDLNYRWRFAPGSDLIFVWKNAILGSERDEAIDFRNRSYVDGVKALDDLPQTNSVSLRLVYFFNAQSLF